MPNRTSSRLIYGAALGIATYAFRIFSPYQSAICFALLIVGAIPKAGPHQPPHRAYPL